jgi:hypothetical protein
VLIFDLDEEVEATSASEVQILNEGHQKRPVTSDYVDTYDQTASIEVQLLAEFVVSANMSCEDLALLYADSSSLIQAPSV